MASEPRPIGTPFDYTGRSFVFDLSRSVPADTSEEQPVESTVTIPYDGHIVELLAGWRDGADNAVGLRFESATGEKYFPRNVDEEYIGLNDFTHPFQVRAHVDEDDQLVAKFANNDTENPHWVTVVVTVQEDEDEDGIEGVAE